MGNRGPFAAAVAIVLLGSAVVTTEAWLDSPTWDEVAHLPAGIYHLQFARFDLYAVNPPLVRSVAAIPAALEGVPTDWHGYSEIPWERSEFAIARHFVKANGTDVFRVFSLARTACLPFYLIGCFVVYRWSADLYGPAGALLSLSMWCSSSLVLGNGHLLTPDTGAAALAAASTYLYWKWLRGGGLLSAIIAGIALGVAELTKSTLLVFFVLYPAMFLICGPHVKSLSLLARKLAELTAICVTAIYVLNAGYGFEGTFRRLDQFEFISPLFRGGTVTADGSVQVGNRFTGTFVGTLPVPLPRNYVLGIDAQRNDFESRMWSYLNGEWRLGGWWYYYLAGLGFKISVGTLCLLLIALGVTVWDVTRPPSPHAFDDDRNRSCKVGDELARYSAAWKDEVVLLLPAIGILLFISSQTGFNHHVRYALPCLPYVFIWLGKPARAIRFEHRAIVVAVACSVVWSLAEDLWAVPHSLSNFNCLAGGPQNGHWHLANSNADWGQDLLHLKRWCDAHPEAQPLFLGYDMPMVDPDLAGITSQPIPVTSSSSAEDGVSESPSQLTAGWYAISVNWLHRRDHYYDAFLQIQPIARIGYSMYVYQLTADDAQSMKLQTLSTNRVTDD
jgi:hypothetical protein